jgi:glycosyltransferase involved in cell wall biosynthesis
MKRLMICTPTATTRGGVERIMEALAEGLPKRGLEVVFGLARGRFHDSARFRRELRGIEGVDIDSSGSTYGRRRAVRQAIRQVDPDAVLIARLFDAYPAAAELKLEGHRLRLAVTIQAFEKEYFIDAARYAPFVDLCVTSGELVAAAVQKTAGIPADRVVSIPGGIAPPHTLRTPNHDRPLRLGYVGRIETVQKRALDLAGLLDELRRRHIPFTCTIVGSGSQAKELQERSGDHVAFFGWLSPEELYERIYPQLDVLLHFAEFEGITIAPREAMAHGVVPVVSQFVGLAEEKQFLDGSNALTFPVGNVRAAADALVKLHRDRELLDHLGEAARSSQDGIRSAAGALDAWAAAIKRAIDSPPRVGTAVPTIIPHGLLDRVSPAFGDFVRRALGRQFAHGDAGSEWPHWSGEPDPAVDEKLR